MLTQSSFFLHDDFTNKLLLNQLKFLFISTKLDINDRVQPTARTPAFVTLKDHKEKFCSNPLCRLKRLVEKFMHCQE